MTLNFDKLRLAVLSRTALLIGWLTGAWLVLVVTPSIALSVELEVMSFNIRFDKGTDGINNWNAKSNPRKQRVFSVIHSHAPDILGVQEALDNQVADLRKALPKYGFIGKKQDNNTIRGEFSGIFYRTDRFVVVESDTFWLSETPDVPGSYYSEASGATSIRTATWAKLKDLKTARSYFVLNTHWYSNSRKSRRKSAALVRCRVEKHAGDLPLIVLGDLNANEQDAAFRTLCGNSISLPFRLLDSYRMSHPKRQSPIRQGDEGTFHSFKGQSTGRRVDYVLHCEAFRTTEATIEHANFDGAYPSDHYPVTATLHVENDDDQGIGTISPIGETTLSPHGRDSVDDPAIWIDPNSPANSFIIGADKSSRGRLELYNIVKACGSVDGSRFATVGCGKLNNVDLRYGFRLGTSKIDVVVASNRTTNGLSMFRVDPSKRTLVEITGSTDMNVEPYGLSLYQSRDALYAFVSECRGPRVRQFKLSDDGTGRIDATLVRTIRMDGVVEGLVADDKNGVLYVAEEDSGIFRFDAEPISDAMTKRDGIVIDLVGKGRLKADVEGLALFNDGNGGGYLIASSQGDSTFVVYRRRGCNDFVTRFAVGDNIALGVGGAELTDGIEVTNIALGPAFPQGLLVVMHDNRGKEGDNLKLIPWKQIEALIGAGLAGNVLSPRRLTQSLTKDDTVNREDAESE